MGYKCARIFIPSVICLVEQSLLGASNRQPYHLPSIPISSLHSYGNIENSIFHNIKVFTNKMIIYKIGLHLNISACLIMVYILIH